MLKKAKYLFKFLVAEIMMAKVKRDRKYTFHTRPCKSYQDVIDTFALNYRRYLEKGLCAVNESQLLFSKFNLNPCARTFMIDHEGQAAGALTLFEDGELGIPLEGLYPEEVKSFRLHGFKIAEVGALSLDSELLGFQGKSLFRSVKRMTALFSLFKMMYNYALYRELTHLVIVVHPRHEEQYAFLGFERFGPIKDYGRVQGKPALPLILDLKRVERTKRHTPVHDFFYNPMFKRTDYRGMFSWTEGQLVQFATECQEAIEPIEELLTLRRSALLSGIDLHKLALRETFLRASYH